MARIGNDTASLKSECPVKDLALTVQHLMDAATAADLQIIALPPEADKTHEQHVEATQLRHRFDALRTLISAKRDHAVTMQALSPEGALHQLAVMNCYVADLWDLVPSEREDDGQRPHDMLKWGFYSVANVLAGLSAEPRERLAVEWYLPARLSPFERTAPNGGAVAAGFDPEQRLAELNDLMVRVRATRAVAWAREDEVQGDDKITVDSIVARCEREIVDITLEAATIVPHSLRGFALKARLLTCIHGTEETNFTTGEDTLYRSLIGQLLGAAGLSRIDDGADDARDFLDRSDAQLARVA